MELQRQMGFGSYQTAWSWLHKIRKATVAPGRKPRGSIVDVTPTILYFLGVPVGRDMDGYARADVFARAFTAERPITFIPSHGR